MLLTNPVSRVRQEIRFVGVAAKRTIAVQLQKTQRRRKQDRERQNHHDPREPMAEQPKVKQHQRKSEADKDGHGGAEPLCDGCFGLGPFMANAPPLHPIQRALPPEPRADH